MLRHAQEGHSFNDCAALGDERPEVLRRLSACRSVGSSKFDQPTT
jgi:hypothetical protein